MNTLAVQGAFGLASYLFIFFAAIVTLVLARRKNLRSAYCRDWNLIFSGASRTKYYGV